MNKSLSALISLVVVLALLAPVSSQATITKSAQTQEEPLHTLEGHTDDVRPIAFSPDGQTLASGSYDKTVKLWRVSDGALLHTLPAHDSVFDSNPGKPVVWSVAFSPDGQTLASGSRDAKVRLWRVSDGSLLHTLEGHIWDVNMVAFSPDGQTLASGAWATVKLWRVSDGSLLYTLEGHTKHVKSVAFSPDGQTLASLSDDYTLKLWKVSEGSLLHTLSVGDYYVDSVAFSPDGQLVASAVTDGTVKLWRVSDGELLDTLQGDSGGGDSLSLAFSPDGQTLAAGSEDDTVRLWRVSESHGSYLHTLQGHTHIVNSLSFSPDGQLLASGSWDSTVKLWSVLDGTLLHSLEGHTDFVWSIAFSPDGQTLASSSRDTTVKLWAIAATAPSPTPSPTPIPIPPTPTKTRPTATPRTGGGMQQGSLSFSTPTPTPTRHKPSNKARLEVGNFTINLRASTADPLAPIDLDAPQTAETLRNKELWIQVENTGGARLETENYLVDVVLKGADGATLESYSFSSGKDGLETLPHIEPGDTETIGPIDLYFFTPVTNGNLEVTVLTLAERGEPKSKPITITQFPGSIGECLVAAGLITIKPLLSAGKKIPPKEIGLLVDNLVSCGQGNVEDPKYRKCLAETTATWAVKHAPEYTLKEKASELYGVIVDSIEVLTEQEKNYKDLKKHGCMKAGAWIGAMTWARNHKGAKSNSIVTESPVYPLVTNKAGQRTGFLATGEAIEEIPDSRAIAIGERHIVLYEGTDPVDVEIAGYEAGTMDLHATFAGSGESSNTLSYMDVPVVQGMQAKLQSSAAKHMLEIDINHDGKADQSQAPVILDFQSNDSGSGTSSLSIPMLVALLMAGLVLIVVISWLAMRRKRTKPTLKS